MTARVKGTAWLAQPLSSTRLHLASADRKFVELRLRIEQVLLHSPNAAVVPHHVAEFGMKAIWVLGAVALLKRVVLGLLFLLGVTITAGAIASPLAFIDLMYAITP